MHGCGAAPRGSASWRRWRVQAGESGDAIWELLTTASPPFKALADDLDPGRRDELHAAWVEFYEGFRTADGIRVPHGYVLILGRRRDDGRISS